MTDERGSSLPLPPNGLVSGFSVFSHRPTSGAINRGRRTLLLLCVATVLSAADQATPPGGMIDLPTALRLAGAGTLEVEIAREKVTEARAASDSARARYFPFITPSIAIRRHDEKAK